MTLYYIFASVTGPRLPGWYNQALADGGPVYAETHPGHFIVEPWNAVSSLFIIAPAIFWAWKLRGSYGRYRFLSYCLPLAALGGSGSTLFHAFRASSIFLFMDVLPAAVLSLSVGIYFWLKVLPKGWLVILILLPFLALRFAFFEYLPHHTAINLSYAVAGVTVLLPLAIHLYLTHLSGGWYILFSALLFLLALFCREADAAAANPLAMGTHFLWHLLSGAGTWLLFAYLYHYRQHEIETASP
jgi:hypothetical protein